MVSVKQHQAMHRKMTSRQQSVLTECILDDRHLLQSDEYVLHYQMFHPSLLVLILSQPLFFIISIEGFLPQVYLC